MDYKDKLRLAKEALESGSYDKETIEYIFPELKESEDERIRKWIIGVLSTYEHDRDLRDAAIAWLENAQYAINHAKREGFQLGYKAGIEKQGKQKPIKEHNACDFCEDRYGCVNHCPMKLIEEEKPVDKVEPKFKVGDWVVDKNGTVRQILSYKDGVYKNTYGYSAKIFEDEWRMWDITKDAKDGDVLFTSSTASHETFVFKSIDENGNAKCYFAYDSEDGFREGTYHFIGRAANCKPATKEQKDLLFQKLKGEGYEWNAEKKELKKIEQKPDSGGFWEGYNTAKEKFEQKSSWSEDDELHIKELESLVKRVWAIAEHENDKDTIHKMSDLSFFLKTLKPQLKQEWSEDDEERLSDAIFFVREYQIPTRDKRLLYAAKETEDWLRTFKDKVQPQSKQEWSEEDESLRRRCIGAIDMANLSDYTKDSLLNWLKSLRPHSRWKPSEEQMDMLAKLCSTLHLTSGENEIMESLYEQLEKLREE